MEKRFLSFVLVLAGLFSPIGAQGQIDECSSRLENASVLFNSGIFEEIPLLLQDCLESLSGDEQRQAYRLIILGHYMNDEVEAADSCMKELLHKYPDFRLGPDDPAEFQYLFESFRVNRVMECGFFTGPIFTSGIISEAFSPFSGSFSYKSGLPGLTAGIMVNVPLGSLLSIGIEPAYSMYSFHLRFNNKIDNTFNLDQTERNSVLHLPMIIHLTFLDNKVQPYLKTGIQLDLLLASETRSQLERTDPVSGVIVNTSELITSDQSAFRERYYLYLGGGAGLKINFSKFFLFAETQYYHPITHQLASGKNRYEQANLWTEGWTDSDFRIIQASFRVGIALNIYSVKKIR